MIPVVLVLGAFSLIAALAGRKASPAFVMGEDLASHDASLRRFIPEVERLLSLLVLYSRDRVFLPGEKRYLSKSCAHEAHALALRLRLRKTARAMENDGPLPDDEFIRGRSVASAVISHGTHGRLN